MEYKKTYFIAKAEMELNGMDSIFVIDKAITDFVSDLPNETRIQTNMHEVDYGVPNKETYQFDCITIY